MSQQVYKNSKLKIKAFLKNLSYFYINPKLSDLIMTLILLVL